MSQRLIEDNMNLVYSVISKEYPAYLHDEDIVQSGMVGLCVAAQKWDESKSEFSTYAWKCIRTEILQEFRKRKKHHGVLSLDYEVTDGEGGKTTLGDLCVGNEDVEYIDMELLYSRLTDFERMVFNLHQQGIGVDQIAKELDCSKQVVQKKIRKIKSLWSIVNEEI